MSDERRLVEQYQENLAEFNKLSAEVSTVAAGLPEARRITEQENRIIANKLVEQTCKPEIARAMLGEYDAVKLSSYDISKRVRQTILLGRSLNPQEREIQPYNLYLVTERTQQEPPFKNQQASERAETIRREWKKAFGFPDNDRFMADRVLRPNDLIVEDPAAIERLAGFVSGSLPFLEKGQSRLVQERAYLDGLRKLYQGYHELLPQQPSAPSV